MPLRGQATQSEAGDHMVEVHLGAFAMDALTTEARRQGVDTAELLAYAGMYLLADIDSGRAGRRGVIPSVS